MESLYAKLRPGPGRSQEEVFASQRARLRTAMIELTAEQGYEGITVRSLARTASVSTRSFYKHFANVEECFISTYEALMGRALRRARAAQSDREAWDERLRAIVLSILEDSASHPKEAQLVLVESFALGSPIQPRMREMIAGFERLLTDIFSGAPETPTPLRQIVCGMAGAVMRVARQRVLAEEDADVEALADELSDWMLALTMGDPSSLQVLDQAPIAPFSYRNGTGLRPDGRLTGLGGFGDDTRRILSATIKLAATSGVSNLTVPKIRAEAGVSRRSFDSRFAGVHECLLEAVEAVTSSAAARADGEVDATDGWEVGIHRATRRLCSELARNPRLAHLIFVDLFSAGSKALECRERLVSAGASRLLGAAPLPQRQSELHAEASAAAAWRTVHSEIAASRANELRQMAPTLSYVALAPTISQQLTNPRVCDFPEIENLST